MNEILHILERALMHFYMSSGFFLMTLVCWAWLSRKCRHWPKLTGWGAYAIPAFVIFAFVSMREVWDVNNGQSTVKAVTDWISWVTGLGVTIWGIHRLFPVLSHIERGILNNRANLQQYKVE